MLSSAVMARSVFRRGLFMGTLALAVTACGAEPEPAFGPPSSIEGRVVPGLEEGTSTTTPTGDGGTTPGGDPLFPTGAAEPPAPTQSATAAHQAKGAPAMLPTLECGSCHKAGGTAARVPWAIAGYVENGKDGKGASGAVVVAVDGATRVAAKSDADGFFWAAGAEVKAGKAGVRLNAGNIRRMSTSLSTGGGNCGCTSCHNGAAGTITVQ